MKSLIDIALFLCSICLAGCWESEPVTKTDAPVTDLDQSISPSDGWVLEDAAGDGLLTDPGLPPADTTLPEDSTPVSASFGLYFLADSGMNAWKAAEQELEQLVLAPAPFLSEADISSYDTCNHVLKLTQAGVTHLQAALGTDAVPSVYGRPFVVSVGTQRIYLGAFWYAYSSLAPQVPYIEVLIEPHRIWRDYSDGTQSDQRADPRIYRVLKNAGVLIE